MGERRVRDPRVVKIAEELALAFPYGFEYVKNGPSAADYHAALIAVKTLDEDAEYEYNIEFTVISTGNVSLYRDIWEPEREWLEREIAKDFSYRGPDGSPTYTLRLVKRRKAGKVEEA